MKTKNDDNSQETLLPAIFSQETTKQLGQVANITGNIASIANSAAQIRISDNKVRYMSEKIAADKEKFHSMLTHIYSRQDKAIDALIAQIDHGVNTNNNEIILQAMTGLATIVASNPWPDFDAFNKMIDSGDDIEF